MEKSVKERLIFLAGKYETKDFLAKDPSKFMHQFSNPQEQEVAAFISANMSFGRRDQILLHVEKILADCKDSPVNWILSEKYKSFFTQGTKSFYRMYTHNDMILFCDGIKNMLIKSGTIGNHIQNQINESEASGEKKYAAHIIASNFSPDCNVIPHTKESASKKLNMFLRWMVRKNSPVDLGLWSSWFNAENLLMPLDTHVMQQATLLKLIPSSSRGKPKSASLKTAIELTEVLKEVFPSDPVKADYALFGYGVEND